jgi:hypothetical protein
VIPIREAIETGAWLRAQFRARDEGEPEANNGNDVVFRIRIKEFEKVDLTLLDEPEKLSEGVTLESNIWRLSFDFVNLCKKELKSFVPSKRLFLRDAEGFEFKIVEDWHLTAHSDLAKSFSMNIARFHDYPPKIRRYGSYAFELPDEFDELSLIIRNGELREA